MNDKEMEDNVVDEEVGSGSSLSAYLEACREGYMDTVVEILGAGSVKVNDTLDDGITGLHWACINNRLKLVKYLIEQGADPNIKGGELNATPLHWACRQGLVYVVDYLISNTLADPNLRDSQDYNALHLAVHSSNIILVVYLLFSCCDARSEKKMYVDDPDSSNRTALHWASYQNDVFTVYALLKFGADVSKVDTTLFTPLHWSFMRGYKNVMKALVEAGSDIFAKNDQNKDSFDVAQDMDCVYTWKKVLVECGRDPKHNWSLKKQWISPKTGKIITFLAPYVILPISLAICTTSSGLAIPKIFASFTVFAFCIYLVKLFIIPTYILANNPLPKSPILAGVFSATAFWCIIVWLYNILPKLIFKNFIANLLLSAVIVIFVWSFFKAMFINPGFVPIPTDNAIIHQQIKELISEGKFDTDHFCVNTFIRKPLRSKYSRQNQKLVARFDHYCPWVYNEVGVRNHKLFITFVYALNLAILIFTYLSIEYFDAAKDGYESDDEDNKMFFCSLIGEDLCFGYNNHQFHFNLMIWCLLQYIWIVFLCVVQTFQILKGLTTWEFSLLSFRNSNKLNYSTIPTDIVNDASQPVEPFPKRRHSEFSTCLHLLGIDQFILTIKMTIASLFSKGKQLEYDPLHIAIPTDYGLKQNWLDFWIIGEVKWRNIFYLPIEGENNLNGQVVDYYKLYEYPSKSSEEII
ncbi:AKR1 [Candida oxycetoniae]|uniref:Palmitoyltransferase n=1 Tax=Candida oxycetoniae TaxID=497107 RepID=A0AAI9WYZ6_9ASCO|nr:AKR1 [Candida oxycetoniae]KAI3405663.2 AKR1 [Candida oxycetoniae]